MKDNTNGEKHTLSFYADSGTAAILNELAEQYQVSKSQLIVLAVQSFEQYLKEGLLGIKKGRTEVVYHNGYNGGKNNE